MSFADAFLSNRSQSNELRSLSPWSFRDEGTVIKGTTCYSDFSSNDYLNLSRHPVLIDRAYEAMRRFGMGSTGSRLLSGDYDLYHELEHALSTLYGGREVLVFNSGYHVNTGVISALMKPGDVIFADRLVHASIVDGIRLSGARLFRFRHNDMSHLADLLARERRRFKDALIVTESVFSMDGDVAPLGEMADMKDRYHARLMVDDAHAVGIYGENGTGWVENAGLCDRVELITATFGKALGGFGAYVVCDEIYKSFFINASRPFIFSTALPLPVVAWNLAVTEMLPSLKEPRKILLENTIFMRDRLLTAGAQVTGESHILPVMTGTNDRAVALAGFLRGKGFLVYPVRYPTVPKGQARIRLSLTSGHTRPVLEACSHVIAEFISLLPKE